MSKKCTDCYLYGTDACDYLFHARADSNTCEHFVDENKLPNKYSERLYEIAYQQGRADENKRVVEILHNFYEVRNPEQNTFMDRLVMEVMREQLKEHRND